MPTQVAVDQTDSMVMTSTVVRKIQKLAYNQSTTVRNELHELPGACAPNHFPQCEEKQYKAGTQRLQVDWLGWGSGLVPASRVPVPRSTGQHQKN